MSTSAEGYFIGYGGSFCSKEEYEASIAKALAEKSEEELLLREYPEFRDWGNEIV